MEPKSQQGADPQGSGNLPVIPSPAGTRWREFRVKHLPLLVFAVTVITIWRLWLVLPPSVGVRGIGEGTVALITAPQDGFLDEIELQSYGWVEAGTEVVTILPFDPNARLDVLQSQLQLSRLALEPSIADRNVLNYEQLRVDALGLKQELAMAKANLERALRVLPRHEALLEERLISRDVYDLTLRDRDYFRAEVEEKSKALEEIEGRLGELRRFAGGTNSAAALFPDLEQQMEAVRTNWNELEMHAPISGEVVFHRRSREFVRAGELIAEIHSPKADRIIAYVKQPIMFEPQVGASVEVVTRSNNPKRFMTEVAQVGARVEVITNAIAYLAAGAVVDTGLPFILPVPDDVHIRPGEIVEVLWTRESNNPTLAQGLPRQ